MKVLFNVFVYSDETYRLIQAGAKDADDVDYAKDMEVGKIVIDVNDVSAATPDGDKDERTFVRLKSGAGYTLKYPFTDYCRLTKPLSASNYSGFINT